RPTVSPKKAKTASSIVSPKRKKNANVVWVSAVVAPSLALDYQDESDFMQRGNSGSRPAAQRFNVISSESNNVESLSIGSSSSLNYVSNPLLHQTKAVTATTSPAHEAGTSFAALDSASLIHEVGTSSAVPDNTSPANDFYKS
ncbi:hypothetical protein Tco_0958674, partial [Tanacetum coccineum]